MTSVIHTLPSYNMSSPCETPYMCGVYFRHSVFRDDIERKTERMHHFARPGEKGNLIPDF